MLILTRRTGQNLRIGTSVSVTVLEVKGNQVRVGIEAPKSLSVHREEVYVRIQKERKLGNEPVEKLILPVGRPRHKLKLRT